MPVLQGHPLWLGSSPISCHLLQEKNMSMVMHYTNSPHFVDLNKEGSILST